MSKINTQKENLNIIYYSLRLFYLSAILSFIILSFSWSNFNSKSKIKSIQFSKTKVLAPNNYKFLLNEFSEDELSKINIIEITEIIENHPYVKAARISNHYPNKIKIEIVEREPIAILNTDPIIMIDQDGYVLPFLNNMKNFDLPILTNFNFDKNKENFGAKISSTKINEAIGWLYNIQENYKYLYGNLSELKITSSDEIELILSDYPTRILLGQSEIETRIKILKEFQKTLKPEKISNYSYLDMRYKNQIIVKEKKS